MLHSTHQIHRLRKKYVKLAKRLKATGEGLKDDNNDDSGDDGEAKEIYMRFYIAPDGPDHDTSGEARNIWGACRYSSCSTFTHPPE